MTLLAQERGDVGLTLGYPAAVGIIWHASDKLALRPEFSVSRSSTDVPSDDVVEGSNWAVGIGISGLWYISRTDNLRTYVSPRYSYSRSASTSRTTTPFGSLENEVTTSTSTIIGSFGAQYSLSPRFSAFGEVGFGYSRGSLRGSLSNFKSTSHNWSTRSGAGFILYF